MMSSYSKKPRLEPMNLNALLFASSTLLAGSLIAQGTPEVEPNDDFTTATALAPNTQGDGAIGVGGDFDFYAVTLTGNSDLRVWVNVGFGATPLADSDVALLDTDGVTEIAFNDDHPNHWLSEVVAGDLPAGTYFVRVRSSQTFDPSGTGAYTLDVVAAAPGTYVPAIPPATPGPNEAPEENDPREPLGMAGVTPLDTDNVGDISAAVGGSTYTGIGDYDFYEITVPAPGLLVMTTDFTGLPAPAMTDTVIHLADAALARIAFNDDIGFPNYLSRLEYNITTPGTYYVAVSGWDTGAYQLRISLAAATPLGDASVTIQTGGCGPTLGARANVAGPAVITETPCLGSEFYVDGAGIPANGPLLRVLGLGTLGTPYDLGPFGAPGCLVEVDPIDQSFAMADANGNDFWMISSPADPAFIGLPIEQQIAVLDGAANALGLTMSNRVSSVFGVDN